MDGVKVLGIYKGVNAWQRCTYKLRIDEVDGLVYVQVLSYLRHAEK